MRYRHVTEAIGVVSLQVVTDGAAQVITDVYFVTPMRLRSPISVHTDQFQVSDGLPALCLEELPNSALSHLES